MSNIDPTEGIRRVLTEEINSVAAELTQEQLRQSLEAEHGVGNVWDTAELQRDFVVHGFLAPFVSVTRKVDGVKGVLAFAHSPRLYFKFTSDA